VFPSFTSQILVSHQRRGQAALVRSLSGILAEIRVLVRSADYQRLDNNNAAIH
jgi:hypothetical protein